MYYQVGKQLPRCPEMTFTKTIRYLCIILKYTVSKQNVLLNHTYLEVFSEVTIFVAREGVVSETRSSVVSDCAAKAGEVAGFDGVGSECYVLNGLPHASPLRP